MSELVGLTISISVSVFIAAWFTVLPTIGLLWSIGLIR